jgi:branched-chain amino acid transport system ATP-binding protein
MLPYQRARLGMARTFQHPHVFTSLTVSQNLMVPLLHARSQSQAGSRRVKEVVDLVGLGAYATTRASELSGGQQKLVEFARALMTSPRLVLLDEPFGGVHPEVKAALLSHIQALRESKVSFIIVSHEIPDLMTISDKVLCMSDGKIIASGTPSEVAENAQVISAYLGHARAAHE